MKLTRSAGILLHITSLPSPFGIGDLGPEAYSFADFLNRSKQSFWQILPINLTEAGQGHSPYSAISSFAGNTLLISPEVLVEYGWLGMHDIIDACLPKSVMVDFANAEKVKGHLFDKAWITFNEKKDTVQETEFRNFCKREAFWLHDFSLYVVLKEQNEGKPWFEWDDIFKDRDKKYLKQLEQENTDAILKVKWLQYVFSNQWSGLKTYANSKGIQFFGDLPFYCSYDSADVWSNRDLFHLDEKGTVVGMAGVPPDGFSADGQLWGMPVFKWEVHKKDGYQWWISRLKKNMELFDLLRLDHFRAFADYWEIPAGEETAKNGEWKRGPNADLFYAVKSAFGDLPFIAEDLGEIDQPVYDLRDEFHFAGMKILQFAFGGDFPDSPYIPHNYTNNFVVYTGTHDNNTTKGWYRQEGHHFHHQISQYTGNHLSENEINTIFNRLAYASVADMAILPLQDVLGLDENARMNVPGSTENNWTWRFVPGQINPSIEHSLQNLAWLYNRLPKNNH